MAARPDKPTPNAPGAAPAVALAPVPRLALTRSEAAASLGMSLDSFERYVQPSLRMIRGGRMRLVPVSELSRWVETQGERVLAS